MSEPNRCKTCGGGGKIWETGCEATGYLKWTSCPDCPAGHSVRAAEGPRGFKRRDPPGPLETLIIYLVLALVLAAWFALQSGVLALVINHW